VISKIDAPVFTVLGNHDHHRERGPSAATTRRP
jgi:hypothetical protein